MTPITTDAKSHVKRMTPLVVLGLALSLVGFGQGAEPIARDQTGTAVDPSPSSALEGPVEIPFELNSGKIYVQVSLEGSEPAWFILDAGSPHMILDTSMARALDLTVGAPRASRGAGDNTFPMVPIIGKIRARIGTVELSDLIANAGPLDHVVGPFEGRRVQGVIGVRTLFSRFVIEIDYDKLLLNLHAPARFKYEGTGTVLPLIVRGPRMIVRGVVAADEGDSVSGEFLIDTGLRGALLLHTPFVNEHDLVERTRRTIQVVTGGGLGGRVTPRVGRLRYFETGGIRVTDLPAWFGRSTKDANSTDVWSGVLGSAFLQRFRVYFDYSGSRLILEEALFDETRVDFDKSGMFLVAEGTDYAVHRVLDLVEDGPATQAGIQVGDIIESVGGNTGLSLEDVRRRLRGPGGTPIDLVVLRGSRCLRKRIVLRPLI